MFNVWRAPASRPTRDIDLLGYSENSTDSLAEVMRDVCRQGVEADGLEFDADSVAAIAIREDADYEGVRVTFRGALGNARISMQIDVGFGDIVSPGAEATDYPTILDHPAPQLLGYSRESAVAEKFEAMVKLGLLNSRMKDFYDIWLLSQRFDFVGAKLASAIDLTFARRGTTVTAEPTAFSSAFATDPTKAAQWQAFLRKSRLSDAPRDLVTVVAAISEFLSEPAAAVNESRPFKQTWRAPGPWTT